jgi:hypothetical protein
MRIARYLVNIEAGRSLRLRPYASPMAARRAAEDGFSSTATPSSFGILRVWPAARTVDLPANNGANLLESV